MNISFFSSEGRCGIHDYTWILMEGFRELGHGVRFQGVPNGDDRALFAAARAVPQDEDLVVIEYEGAIFRLRALVFTIAYLRWIRRKQVLLSVHEIEPAKFPEYYAMMDRLNQSVYFSGLREIGRIIWATADVALRYGYLRFMLFLLGFVAERIVLHSTRTWERLGIMANPYWEKVYSVPLVFQLQDADAAALRRKLALPDDRFLFIVPGFFFRRKQIVEVVKQFSGDGVLLIVGSGGEPGYVDEVRAAVASRPDVDIRLIEDYEGMEEYLLASDVVILYYSDGFQSLFAGIALGAGKPCIFSDISAFEHYTEGGLVAGSPLELQQAMQQIQEPETCERLRNGALRLRQQYSPKRIAEGYLQPYLAGGPDGARYYRDSRKASKSG